MYEITTISTFSLHFLPSIHHVRPREEQEKAERVILESAEDYPEWRSYTISALQEKNCDWTITGRPEPTREKIQANLESLGFLSLDFSAKALYISLSTEIKEHRAAIKKGEGIIRKSVAHKHHPILEGKNAQEMWAALKDRFQHVSPMSTSRILLEMAKTKLSDCKDIDEYTSVYQAAYDQICGLTTEDSDLSTKGAGMLLQAAMLLNMGNEYAGIVSTIESEWKNGTTDPESTILRLVKYEAIRKGNEATGTEQSAKTTILLSSTKPAKPESLRAPKGSCTNPECVAKNVTSHYTDHCFLKHPELRRPRYSLQQMGLKGSKGNLRNDNPSANSSTPAATTPTTEPNTREA